MCLPHNNQAPQTAPPSLTQVPHVSKGQLFKFDPVGMDSSPLPLHLFRCLLPKVWSISKRSVLGKELHSVGVIHPPKVEGRFG